MVVKLFFNCCFSFTVGVCLRVLLFVCLFFCIFGGVVEEKFNLL